jgi:hypothetical protein
MHARMIEVHFPEIVAVIESFYDPSVELLSRCWRRPQYFANDLGGTITISHLFIIFDDARGAWLRAHFRSRNQCVRKSNVLQIQKLL